MFGELQDSKRSAPNMVGLARDQLDRVDLVPCGRCNTCRTTVHRVTIVVGRDSTRQKTLEIRVDAWEIIRSGRLWPGPGMTSAR